MRLIKIQHNTFINTNLVSQIYLDRGGLARVIVTMACGEPVFLMVPKGQNPGKFLWVIKEWIRTGFHPYGFDKEPEVTDDTTGMFDINMLRAER